MNTKPLYLAVAVTTALAHHAHAGNQAAADQLPVSQLEDVEVRLVVPTNVQVLGQSDLKKSATQNIEDMTMYEPGVDVATDNMRLGHQSFSIRGIDGNRILMTVDGIALPDEQKDIARGGLSQVATRDNIESDTLKQVRIIKGGNGTAQGDGAVGGSVNMQTFSPLDFVNTDKPWHAGIKYSYRSTYDSHGVTASGAIKQGDVSALLMLTQRKLHQAENYPADDASQFGERRTESNQQDTTQKNVLAKLLWDKGVHQTELTLEHFTRDVQTELLSQQGTSRSQAGGILQRPVANALDEYKRQRVSLDYRYFPEAGVFDALSVKAYHQEFNSKDHQKNHSISTPKASSDASQPGTPAAVGSPNAPTAPKTIVQTLESHNSYDQKIQGIRPELTKSWQTGSVWHSLVVGGEYRRTQTSRLQFQDVDDSRTGQAKNTGAYFPPSDRRVGSLYIQDNMTFANKATLGLGLRYEMEKSTFDFNHPSYLVSTRNNPQKFDSSSNRVLLPSVGISYPLAENLIGSFAYRRGYRSADVNFTGAGYDSGRGYRVIPNPDLKPESSDNYELGLNWSGDKLKASTSVFYHRYKDFINNTTVTDQKPPAGYRIQFRYDNVGRARTYGAEAKVSYLLNERLKALASFAWIDTKNQTTNEPMSTGYPVNGVLGLDYTGANWDLGARLRLARANNKVPSSADTPYFKAPGYAVLDMVGSYQFNDHLSVHAGVYNVLDKKYWLSGDTKGVLDNIQKDRFTQPGRNFAISAEMKF